MSKEERKFDGFRKTGIDNEVEDEFLETQSGLQIKTLDWTNAPAGYLIKP